MNINVKVAKWGNSLALRLPAELVEAMSLKAGDDIEVQAAGPLPPSSEQISLAREALAKLRKYRGRLPADFKFDRAAAFSRQS
jgi:antitoxin MazE